MGFSQNLKTFMDCLSYLSQAESDKLYDFSRTKANYYMQTGKSKLNDMKKEIISLSADPKDLQKVSQLLQLLERIGELYDQKQVEKIKKLIDQVAENYASLDIKETKQTKFGANLPDFPSDIQNEMKADFEELQKCFDSQCYRASVILCARILEIGLHHLYFAKTNNDLLETSPGIGLGKIVAKLSEKSIDLGPGINEQIHLINKVRVSSVHKKKETFKPSKEQTHAMILYTLDILNKIFQK
ncbi:DUF4145 domain-containing protein [Candidatus Woesearchaeota archaeon]|nr:DUF4145 domain-containing protein [Candidatus Woesearchaeota archaeon]